VVVSCLRTHILADDVVVLVAAVVVVVQDDCVTKYTTSIITIPTADACNSLGKTRVGKCGTWPAVADPCPLLVVFAPWLLRTMASDASCNPLIRW
jgi:hypothetical protein